MLAKRLYKWRENLKPWFQVVLIVAPSANRAGIKGESVVGSIIGTSFADP